MSVAWKVALIWVSRSMRSTTINTVGLCRAACRRIFWAAKTISRDLPEPWKCQIRPLRGIAGQHALDDHVGAVVLLVAADDLQAAFLLIGGEQGEVGQDVQDDMSGAAATGPTLLISTSPPAVSGPFRPPGTPLVERRMDRPVAQVFAFGRHVEDIAA